MSFRPFFDRISYSGSQAEIDTLKEHVMMEPVWTGLILFSKMTLQRTKAWV